MTIVALLLPWLLGLCWLFPLRRNVPLWLGYGYLLGIMITTLVMQLEAASGWPLDFTLLVASIALLTLLGLVLTRNLAPATVGYPAAALGHGARWLGGLLVVLLLVRYAGLGYELWLRPLTPWDSWTIWGLRARAWSGLGHLVPFVSPQQWLHAPNAGVYTVAAWGYPSAVSLIQTWMVLAWGSWHAGIANLPWLLCVLALALGFYGQARCAGLGPLGALLGIYLLLSLPLLNTHVALAGYADLWLATAYGLAAMALVQWLAGASGWQLVLALLLGLVCLLLKVEGVVWVALLLPLLLLRLPGRWPLVAGIVLLALFIGWYSSGGVEWGPVILTPQQVALPYVGHFTFRYTNSWATLGDNLLLQSSWHLLWYWVPLGLVLGLPRILRDRQVAATALLIILGLAMLFVLFFLTGAEVWARRGTSINRLFLHLAPVAVFFLALLARPAPPGTEPQSVPLPDR